MMRHREKLTFNPIPITPAQLVAAMLKYDGMAYADGATVVDRDEKGELLRDGAGIVQGHGNCFGVLFLAAIDLGLWSGDPNLPPSAYSGQDQIKTLAEVLEYNFTTHPRDTVRAGDVLMMRYRDTNPRHTTPHHVALCIESPPNPRMIHASNGAGRIYSCMICPVMLPRIELACRLRNFSL